MKVSVIMPAYNVEQYIEKSIESVMNQTLSDIELIVINDASTDHTWDVISKLMGKYGNKLKGINLSKNVRQGGARNIGIREAVGEYIAFVDSDDWIKPDMLEKFYNAIVTGNADLAGTNRYYLYYSNDNVSEQIGKRDLALELSGRSASKDIREKYLIGIGGICQNIYKKKIIIEHDIWFPEGMSYEDNYFVNLYLGYVTKYIYIDEVFYYYRQNPSSTVRRKDYTQLQRVEIEKMLLEEYKARGLYSDVKDGYDLACIQRWYINTIGFYFRRFGKEGIKLTAEMGAEFRKYFPNYKGNKYYRSEISRSDRIKLVIFEISPRLLYILYKITNRID